MKTMMLELAVIKSWYRPPDQPRDEARREECSDLDEKSLTTLGSLWEGKKDLLESTKMDFYET